jgi:hypothetical protein
MGLVSQPLVTGGTTGSVVGAVAVPGVVGLAGPVPVGPGSTEGLPGVVAGGAAMGVPSGAVVITPVAPLDGSELVSGAMGPVAPISFPQAAVTTTLRATRPKPRPLILHVLRITEGAPRALEAALLFTKT